MPCGFMVTLPVARPLMMVMTLLRLGILQLPTARVTKADMSAEQSFCVRHTGHKHVVVHPPTQAIPLVTYEK